MIDIEYLYIETRCTCQISKQNKQYENVFCSSEYNSRFTRNIASDPLPQAPEKVRIDLQVVGPHEMAEESSERIGIRQFGGAGYAEWSYRMEVMLDEKGLLEHVKGEQPQDPTEEWKQDDKKAKALVIRCIHDDLLDMTRDCTTAFDVWGILKSTFNRSSVAKRLLLETKLHNLKLRENEPLQSFFMRFDKTIRELRDVGKQFDELDKVVRLLMLMPEQFRPVIAALQTMEEADLTLSKAKSILLEEELRMSGKTSEEELSEAVSSAMSLQERGRRQTQRKRKCYICGSEQHLMAACPRKANNDTDGKAAASKSENRSFAMAAHGGSVEQVSDVWFILDSGCSEHLVNDVSLLSGVAKLKSPFQIAIAMDGVKMCGTMGGHISGRIADGEEDVKVTLHDVIYVPECRDNLMSVQKLVERGNKVVFDRQGASISREGKVFARATVRNGIYWLRIEAQRQRCATAVTAEANMNSVWHRRLGHLNMKDVCSLVRRDMVTGVGVSLSDDLDFCEDCARAKQTKAHMGGTRTRATKPLELVHSDVCGPITPTTYDGYKYFITFTDDWTHMVVVYLMRTKDEAFSKLKEFHAMATTHFGTKMKRLRCDNGGEYRSRELKEFCVAEGIVLDFVPPYTPQLNGVAERINRTLCEKTRAMLVDAELDKRLWGEALNTAVYLTNRSPTRAVQGMTPYEAWFSRKPDLSNLRIFGCQAFATVPKEYTKKLDDRAVECVFLGYGVNCWRLWDAVKEKIICSRSVKFNESKRDIRKEEFDEMLPLVVDVSDIEAGCEGHEPDEFMSVGSISEEDLSEDGQQSEEDPLEVRQNPERNRRQPTWMRSGEYDLSANAAMALECFMSDAPESYQEIRGRDDEAQWMQAVKSEMEALELNRTWTVVKNPGNVKVISSKWVFKRKDTGDGKLEQCKARLVARGFLQKRGVDFVESYAPVARLPTIRFVLALGVQYGYHFRHLDVKTAFLNGVLKENVYMYPPDGMILNPGFVLKLRRSLYGLKQSPKCWNDRFHEFITSLGFRQSSADVCLYYRASGDTVVYLVIYVDDMLLCGSSTAVVDEVRDSLAGEFRMTDLGEPGMFMGIRIRVYPEKGVLQIDQGAYTERLLEKFGMAGCNSAMTPMEQNLKLKPGVKGEKVEEPYRQLIGSLMYLMSGTRPDICFALTYLARFQENPTQEHWQCLKRILRYLSGTINVGLRYSKQNDAPALSCNVDADWANDLTDRKSTTGFFIKVYGNVVQWCSRKQAVVALSSCEAEYVAACDAAKEVLWLLKVMDDLDLGVQLPVKMLEDNSGCISVSENPETRRSKHYDVRYHFLRQKVQEKVLQLVQISSQHQVADTLTKALGKVLFFQHRKGLGLVDLRGGVEI